MTNPEGPGCAEFGCIRLRVGVGPATFRAWDQLGLIPYSVAAGEGLRCRDEERRVAGGGDLPRLGGHSLPRRGRLLLGLGVRP